MGLNNLSSGEQPDQDSDKPSISYLYLFQEGREEVENWPEQKRETMAQAYGVTSGGGVVRNTFKASGEYVNIHDATAHLMVGIAEVFENEDFQPLLEFIGPTADAVGRFLDNNEEIRDELLSRLEETQAAD